MDTTTSTQGLLTHSNNCFMMKEDKAQYDGKQPLTSPGLKRTCADTNMV